MHVDGAGARRGAGLTIAGAAGGRAARRASGSRATRLMPRNEQLWVRLKRNEVLCRVRGQGRRGGRASDGDDAGLYQSV